MTICCFLSDLVEYIVCGTVIQEVKTSNITREVYFINQCMHVCVEKIIFFSRYKITIHFLPFLNDLKCYLFT